MRVTPYGNARRAPSALRKHAVSQAIRMARAIFDDPEAVERELREAEAARKRGAPGRPRKEGGG